MNKLEQAKCTPLVSVVISVYNTEKYLARCVDSILAQSYRQLEIILVDDCSTDGCAAIIEHYEKANQRVKTVRHERNRGLFQAWLTGSELATGKYISFVDSDDYISIDWFRKLVQQAEDTESDIVVGEWSFDAEDKGRYYCNLEQFRIRKYCLEADRIRDAFMDVQDRNFSWTVLWNKLYRKDLWDTVYPVCKNFSEKHGDMRNEEDLVFSSALMLYAQKLTNVHGINYFKNAPVSTAANDDVSQNKKYISDASAAMKFFKQVLVSLGLFETYETQYKAWNSQKMSVVHNQLVQGLKGSIYQKDIFKAFGCDEEDCTKETDFFLAYTTPLDDAWEKWEELKKQIISENTEYVSFDIFDTLIQRPFLSPTDLFDILTEKFNENLSAYVDFKRIRQFAEESARKAAQPAEEISFDAIYQYIQDHYAFDPNLIQTIKNYEIELELRYCEQRESGRELYDLAQDCGKKVIICSDMYLPQSVIGQILEKNDYKNYHKLYVSCEIGLTKARKKLYRFVQEDLNCGKPHAILHIGDNLVSDVQNAQACGWRSGCLPKASDVLFGYDPTVYGGKAFSRVYDSPYLLQDYAVAKVDFTAIRSMLGMVANRTYGNPFVSVNQDSDFNLDPRMIGYAVLGPHILSLCKWIYKNVKQKRIGTVHFVARDGYLVKQAFDCFHYPDVKTNYLRLSRKALMLADVERPDGLYSILDKAQPSNLSPKKIAEYFAPIIPEEKKQELEGIFIKNGLPFHKKLKNTDVQNLCLKIFIEQIVDMRLLADYKAKLKTYFSELISPGDYIFDIGYSGRPEAALSNILGFPVGSLYIHTNNKLARIRQEKYKCDCETYFAYKPIITGVMREHILMELGPSTVGYQEINGKMEPVLEHYEFEYCSAFVTRIIQERALDFIKDYLSRFADYKVMFNFQYEAMSAMLEYYLHFSKLVDRQIFETLPFEDDVGIGRVKAVDIWNQETNTRVVTGGLSDIIMGDIIPGVSVDGTYMKLARILTKIFPRESTGRKLLAGFMKLFIK